MPSVITCPSCAGQLRLPDELLGQQVRCPTCSSVFVAEAAPSLPQPAPAPTPVPRNDPPPRGLVGAVEVQLSLDDEAAAPRIPSRPAEPSWSLPPAERDRRDEPEGDLRPCPTCGKRIPRDSTRCYHCGWRLGENGLPRNLPAWDRDRDQDRDGQRGRNREPERRDLEPSRGVMILVLGILSLVCTMLAPLGAILGLVAWVMGHGDLKKIKAQKMEPDGGMTMGGWVCGMIGTLLNSLLTLACLGIFSLILLGNSSRPPATYKQPVQPVPAINPGNNGGFNNGNDNNAPRPMRPGRGQRWKDRDDGKEIF